MAAQELQNLRDIHLPDAPGWWPPAPGWWLLAALAVVAAVWLVMRARARYRRTLPLRHGRRLYADVYARYRAGELTERQYLDASNELIKRVLIHGLGEQEARRATGERWLQLLDRHLDAPAFTEGPGRALGDDRFRPQGGADPDAVHPLVEKLLARTTAAPGAQR